MGISVRFYGGGGQSAAVKVALMHAPALKGKGSWNGSHCVICRDESHGTITVKQNINHTERARARPFVTSHTTREIPDAWGIVSIIARCEFGGDSACGGVVPSIINYVPSDFEHDDDDVCV